MSHVLKTALYMRQGNLLTNLETGETTEHKSINKAKKASHKIQIDQDKMLGRGSVRRRARKVKYKSRTLDKGTIIRKRVGG